jgi:ribosomal protein S18 acetylase RimI-like enzyme
VDRQVNMEKVMSEKRILTIRPAQFPQDLEAVKRLFTAYTESLPVDISFQNFSKELSSLPGFYSASEGGALFLATIHTPSPRAQEPSRDTEEIAIGCLGFRALESAKRCELKRFYVAPESRGLGAGTKLLRRMIEEATSMGYKEMVMDTLPSMHTALKLYSAAGFQYIEKYNDNPLTEPVFLGLKLG